MTHPLLLENIVYMPDFVCYILKRNIYPIKVKDLHLGDSFETYDDITDDGYPVIDSPLKVDTCILYQKVRTGLRIEYQRSFCLSYGIEKWNEDYGLNIREYMAKEAKIVSEKAYLTLEEYENNDESLSIQFSFVRENSFGVLKDVIELAESMIQKLEQEVLESL
ncbi:hypothetical protein QF028_001563 [Neobacillus sp. B4I6]|uniref:hypothetical protein n=1 Tax=Neobacillus sp. B4I6 TaxID=3373925 RepID=UPI003D1BA18A